MAKEEEKPLIQIGKIIRYGIAAVSVGIVLYLLWYFSSVTIYILLGVIFSLIARPLFSLLGRVKIGKRNLPEGVKAILALAGVWIVFLGFFAALIPMVVNEANKLSKIDPDRFVTGVQEPLDKALLFMEDTGLMDYILQDSTLAPPPVAIEKKEPSIQIPVLDTVRLDDTTYLLVHKKIVRPGDSSFFTQPELAEKNTADSLAVSGIRDSIKHEENKARLESLIKTKLTDFFNFSQVTGVFSSVFSLFSEVFIAVFSITFIAFFFIKDQGLFSKMVLAMTPEKYVTQAITIMQESRKMLSRYFIGLALELVIVMCMVAIGLLIIGFKFSTAVTIGFFCGFFNVIPYLGPILGGAFGILLGITSHLDLDVQTELLPLVLKMVAVFSVSQFIDNWFLQPMIFSNSVNAHPLEIFIVILIAGTLAGIPGMVFAVPTYSFLRIIARQFFNHFKFVRSLTQNM